MKVRQNLYLDREITDALEALAAGARANKSRIVNDAVAAWLAHRGAKEVDALFQARLDRLSTDLRLTRRDLSIVIESLALFIRYQLNVTAPLPLADTAARAVGRARFAEFVRLVAEQLATGERSLGDPPNPETAS